MSAFHTRRFPAYALISSDFGKLRQSSIC